MSGRIIPGDPARRSLDPTEQRRYAVRVIALGLIVFVAVCVIVAVFRPKN